MFSPMKLAAVVALALTSFALPAAAAPAANIDSLAIKLAAANDAEPVQWRRHGHGHGHGRGYARGRGWGYGAAFGTGLIIGAAPYYYAPRPYYYSEPYYYARPYYPPSDAVAYCMQRFRSYDPYSGTYLGYDGFRHPCP
jgi:BA14K-like protein